MFGERTIELMTTRCVLRPIATADADRLHALWTSAGVRRFLWADEIIPFERTREVIEQSHRMFRDRGVGLWDAWSNDSLELTGFGGLWPFRDPPELELIYGVAEPLWNKGYATEVARAVLTYCFESLGMPSVRASTDAPNTASIRVLDKLGFTLLRRATVGGLDTVFYELPRPAIPK